MLPGYLEAMGVRPIAGRLLEDADRVTADVVVVNATASRRYFGGNAVGHTLTMGDKTPRQLRIVGVVPDSGTVAHKDRCGQSSTCFPIPVTRVDAR